MKADDISGRKFYIMMDAHGVPGAAVETDNAQVQDAVRKIRQAIRSSKASINKPMLREIQAHLAKNLTKMLPDIIKHGTAVDSNGEFYDRQTFDDDLVLCAVYDHIANGSPIAITDTMGPKSDDTVHEARPVTGNLGNSKPGPRYGRFSGSE